MDNGSLKKNLAEMNIVDEGVGNRNTIGTKEKDINRMGPPGQKRGRNKHTG